MAHPPGDGAGGKSVSAPPRPGKPGVRRHRTGDGPVVPSGGALRDRGRRLPRPGAGVSSRLALIDRLAELLRPTPEGLLPRVVYRETGDLGLTAVQGGAGLALRFPRFTGRDRDDKAPTDATTVQEVLGLYRSARPTPAGS